MVHAIFHIGVTFSNAFSIYFCNT
uniref:Uncharacterized protein n=1 Tax=Rhizophora mucronata TaxID=61149 RepID=A0A2P2NJ01_RHIMU